MDKHVLITGGSRGIGRSLVEAFSAAGYLVSFTYHASEDAAIQLEKETGAKGFSVDFQDPDAVISFAAQITELRGDVKILINNAGVAHYGLIQDVSREDYQKLFSVNFESMFFLTQKVISAMISRHSGTVINIGSVWGETGASCEVLYSASKGAVISFTKALAKELAPSGITVNCISPGVVDTDMLSMFTAEEKGMLLEEIPSGSFTDTEEIAKLALFLASENSKTLTGQIIAVNGGIYC